MSEKLDTTHIMNDCFVLNGEIIKESIDSKLPRPLAIIREKSRRKKLIKMVEKLQKANIPLERDNILEFMSFAYNNISQFVGSEAIYKDKIVALQQITVANSPIWQMGMRVDDNLSCIITIDIAEPKDFQIIIKYIDKKMQDHKYDVRLERMIHESNSTIQDYVQKINKAIIELMYQYIVDTLKQYNDKNYRGYQKDSKKEFV